MCTSAQSQSMPGSPSWHRSARNVCASADACRLNWSAPRAIRYPIGRLPSSSEMYSSAFASSTALSGISVVSSGSCVR